MHKFFHSSGIALNKEVMTLFQLMQKKCAKKESKHFVSKPSATQLIGQMHFQLNKAIAREKNGALGRTISVKAALAVGLKLT